MTDAMMFRKTAVAVYGKRWKKDFAAAMKIDPVTVWRHVESGIIPEEWWFQVMKDAMSNIKTLVIAAQQKGLDLPIPPDQ